MTKAAISTQNDAVRGSNPPPKKKRNLPGNPDPEAEVVALSPKTLMATNRFVCEICGKGFQREQNLQLHKRGHNLPWKLQQRAAGKEARKRVYVCPERTCVHHEASRALGDLTGIKKHFCRKHGEKKWKCDKCAKHYAVHSDWKAHYKTCGTREYKCDCGTIFSRRDSFITHRAFCDALAEETARFTAASHTPNLNYHFIGSSLGLGQHHFPPTFKSNSSNPPNLPLWIAQGNQPHDNSIAKNLQEMHHQFTLDHPLIQNPNPPSSYQMMNWDFGKDQFPNQNPIMIPIMKEVSVSSLFSAQNQNQNRNQNCAAISATALLQRAAQIGATTTTTADSSNIRGKFGRDEDGDKLCGLYSTTNSATSGLGSDVELSVTLDHQMEMYPPLKRCRRPAEEEIGLGETRDFLGVGMHTICNPSSINGWI